MTTIPATITNGFFEKIHGDAYDRFRHDVTGHQLTVIHDDGLYRHLRLSNPDRSSYWYEIITFPGSLVIRGDMGTYLFTREADMFGFFGTGDINPGYWAEKTPSYGREHGIKTYQSEIFESTIKSMAVDFVNDHQVLDIKAFHTALEIGVLTDIGDQHTAVQAAYDFSWNGLAVFPEIHAYDFTQYTPQYLWCCLAIPYAIRHYNAHTTPKDTP